MTPKRLQLCLAVIGRKLREASVTGVEPVYVDADDPSVDDAIELRMAGVPTSLSIQLGRGYYGVNRYLYEDGQLDGFASVYFGPSFDDAVSKLIAAVREPTS